MIGFSPLLIDVVETIFAGLVASAAGTGLYQTFKSTVTALRSRPQTDRERMDEVASDEKLKLAIQKISPERKDEILERFLKILQDEDQRLPKG